MAFYTNRNDIQPVFLCIALMMVILFCLCRAEMAWKDIGSGQFTISNGMIHSGYRFTAFGMTRIILIFVGLAFFAAKITFLTCLTFCALGITSFSFFAFFTLSIAISVSFAFFALPIALLRSFEFFGLMVSFLILFVGLMSTYFAVALKPIFCGAGFAKFRKRFDFFAFATSFRHDFSSHFRLLYRRLWLEPIAPPIGVFGSFYFRQTMIAVKYKFEKYLKEKGINPC